LLQKIASDDNLDGSDWNELREVIKYKVDQNTSLFLATCPTPTPPPPFNPRPSTMGGQRFPPFPPKKLSQLHLYDPPVNYMTKDEAEEAKQAINDQLDAFDDNPPFTIQRLAELLLDPKAYYNSVGKYLRAVEKTLLVTSTIDAYPVPATSSAGPAPSHPTPEMISRLGTNGEVGPGIQTGFPITVNPSSSTSVPPPPSPRTLAFSTRQPSSTPASPMFSPIPFLHADARARTRSRSSSAASATRPPPMTPLTLAGDLPTSPSASTALGLVDELDDPSPGHLSDKPQPLTTATGAKPFTIVEGLGDRFVTGEGGEEESAEDKENSGSAGASVRGKGKARGRGKATTSRKKARKEEPVASTDAVESSNAAEQVKDEDGDTKMDVDAEEPSDEKGKGKAS
ncbi:PPP4R2-domain-containing protein, partial [Coprinopsis sp. MPI-PUGE-AT-0042]